MTMNFQSIMLTLQHFWAERGCLIWQPYYTHVGAGTMNPATVLRVLGPEPWNVAYVEPSIRPDDGRYGDNPNRLQQHYQFQVILKPDPGDPQEQYLDSLKALGIDPRQHDIRFVEDNWESPALGAWGLGWEVWLDGQEITQFTYFQQAGGMSLDPVSVEITYGLERIAIALQRIRGFREIDWGAGLTYGDVNLAAEREHSTYYFETADVENQFELFRLFEAEAKNALARGLVLPAHDYVLKLSHTFNILDARGAVGVTERQAFFKNIRALSRAVSEAYLRQREELGYPWLENGEEKPGHSIPQAVDSAGGVERADFLLEIGVEELPPADTEAALAQLDAALPGLLEELYLDYGSISLYATPRRLVVHVQALAGRQPDREVVFRGPPADRAFDPDGAPTRAAEGFAHGKGLTPQDLVVEEVDGGRYAVARVSEPGRPAAEVLAEALPGLIAGIRFVKSMRWNDPVLSFSRPIRWLLALLDDRVVPFTYAGLVSGRQTRGLRFHSPEAQDVASPPEYFDFLASQGVMLDVGERKSAIREQVATLAGEVDGRIQPDDELLLENTHLVEAPTALRGGFEADYLSLPPEVLVSVMKKHQRYFPIYASGGDVRLLPYFIAVRNGDDRSLDLVVEGNEHVIRARFADAAFFVEHDRQRGLEKFRLQLDTLTFQADLGSMLDKARRIESLISALAPRLGLAPDQESLAERAAQLCKADLASDMVVEMTSLQGVMGRYYALEIGEPGEVAAAIEQHYWPRFSGDRIPETPIGIVVALADRLDSLAGLFAAGLAPTGNKDPFGLRRAALGLIQILVEGEIDFDLQAALRSAATRQPIPVSSQVQSEVLEFIAGRLNSQLREEGLPYDAVDAVVSVQKANPHSAVENVRSLVAWRQRADWDRLLQAYARCVRISRDSLESHPLDPDLLQETAEVALYQKLVEVEAAPRAPGSVDDLFSCFQDLVEPIDAFFEDVLVMAEDENVRRNRLGLLQRITALAAGVVDMSRLEGF